MEELNSHGHDEGTDDQEEVEGPKSDSLDQGLEGQKEEVVDGLRPESPERTTRSPGPSPSPRSADAASDLATGTKIGAIPDHSTDDDHTPADAFTFPTKVTPIGSGPAITNGNTNTTSDISPSNAPNLDSSQRLNTNVVTGQDPVEQVSQPEPAVSDGDLPRPPTEDDQQHFRSIIAGVTEGPIESEFETAEPEVTKPEDLPPAPSAEDHRHFRSIIAGIAEEFIESETETTEPEVLEQEVTAQEAAEHESTEPEPLPSIPSAEDQQHFRSPITGVTEGPTESETSIAERVITKLGHLPPVPSVEDQRQFRSTVASITDESIKPEAETLDQEMSEPESEIADHHPIKSDSQATDDEVTTVPAVVKQQTSTSEVAPPVEEVQREMPGSHLEEDRSTIPSSLADRQQHVRAVLAGVVDDETTEPRSTEMDATVPSTDSEEPSLTPPFVTPMTFIDDVEPTYPETNETVYSIRTPKTTANETKPLDAQDSTSL
jgi:hypothetical protein